VQRTLKAYADQAIIRPTADLPAALSRCLAGRRNCWYSAPMVDAALKLHHEDRYCGYELVLDSRGANSDPAAVAVGITTSKFVSLDTAAGPADLVAMLLTAVAANHLGSGRVADLQWPSDHNLRLCHAPRPSEDFPRTDPADQSPPAWVAISVADAIGDLERGR
jgi:hypothetical protein